jgi:transcriptional regulator with XRE-family HTH domain
MSVISKIKQLAKLKRKAYRDAFVEEHVKTSLPFQIRALREQPDRQWSQAELGMRAGMRQNAISRLEDAESGTPSISTLLRLARAFDVALLVKFVPFSKLLTEFSDLSFEALSAPSFEQELPQLEQAASTVTATYNVPVGTYAAVPGTIFHRLQEAPLGWAAVAATEPLAYRGLSHLSLRFNVEEVVAATLVENTSLGFIVDAAKIAEEEKAPASRVIDSLIAISGDTSIIDYSALKPAA